MKFVNKNKIITYNSKKDQDIDNYLDNIQQNINNSTNDMDMVAFNELIRDSQNKYLEKTFVKRLNNNNKPDPPWFNKEIKKAIAMRRQINKKKRKEKNPEYLNNLKSEFDLQKAKVHLLVRNAVEKHEIDLTNKILNDENRERKIWMHIDNLKNREI